MPTVKQMIERYKELMETSKSCYLAGHETVSDYLRTTEGHYKYMRAYLGAVYVFGFMKDKKFNELSDEIFDIYTESQQFGIAQLK